MPTEWCFLNVWDGKVGSNVWTWVVRLNTKYRADAVLVVVVMSLLAKRCGIVSSCWELSRRGLAVHPELCLDDSRLSNQNL